MNQMIPAFWAVYRGKNDPQIPLTSTYSYVARFYTAQDPTNPIYSLSFAVAGPPQLTKRDYIELRWNVIPFLVQVTINNPVAFFYNSSGSEGGFRDEGQYSQIGGGVTNQ